MISWGHACVATTLLPTSRSLWGHVWRVTCFLTLTIACLFTDALLFPNISPKVSRNRMLFICVTNPPIPLHCRFVSAVYVIASASCHETTMLRFLKNLRIQYYCFTADLSFTWPKFILVRAIDTSLNRMIFHWQIKKPREISVFLWRIKRVAISLF